MTKFKPLACGFHSHTDASLDSPGTVNSKIIQAFKLGNIASCVTDHGTMSALVSHYDACKKLLKDKKIGSPIKSIHGIEAYVIDELRPAKIQKNGKEVQQYYHLTIHFKTQAAYKYFCQLSPIMNARAVVKYGEVKPLLKLEELEPISGQITLGSGCLIGPVQKNVLNGRSDWAEEMYVKLRNLAGPGNFFSEIFPHRITKDWCKPLRGQGNIILEPGKFVPITSVREWDPNSKDKEPCTIDGEMDIQRDPNLFVIRMAEKYGDPIIISLDDHFACEHDYETQCVKISGGKEDWKFSNSYHMYSSEECAVNLKRQLGVSDKQIEEWIDNSYKFVELFDKYKMETAEDRWLLPDTEMVYNVKTSSTDKLMEIVNRVGRLPKEGHPDYQSRKERFDYEVSVLRDNGVADFLPYFFVIEDVASYCERMGILYNCRGCLVGDTQVRMGDGSIKSLDTIRVGEYVYSHTGDKKLVTDCMSYDINENLLEIRTRYSFSGNTMTKDHKVYAYQRGEGPKSFSDSSVYESGATWVKACDLKKGDLLFHPWLKDRKVVDFESIDLSIYADSHDEYFIYESVNKNKKEDVFSVKGLCKKIGVHPVYFRRCLINHSQTPSESWIKRVNESVLRETGISLQEWLESRQRININKVDRILRMDEEFAYMIGKWIGDGWIPSDKSRNYVGYAFNSDDSIEINRTVKFYESCGFQVSTKRSRSKKLVQVYINSKALTMFFRESFDKYKNTSITKYMSWFKYLPDNKLKSLIWGYISADGSLRENLICVDSVSIDLIQDVREALLYLKTPSSLICRDEFYSGEYLCKKSYKLNFGGPVFTNSAGMFRAESGYFLPIIEISEISGVDKVYDITVEGNESYVTNDYAVHNSAGGSYVLYAIGVSITDPFKYDLPFERFLTLGRIKSGSLPDIDFDVQERDPVIAYLKEKYGDRCSLIATNLLMKLKSSILDVERSRLGQVRKETSIMCAMMPAAGQGQSDLDWLNGYNDKDTGAHVPGFLEDTKDPSAEKLRDYIKQNPEIWETVLRCLGIKKTSGVHAGGVIIAPEPVQNFMPTIMTDKGVATAYDMKGVERIGGVKFDFLGVKTLHSIGITLKSIKEVEGIDIKWDEFPHDPTVYSEIVHKDKLAGIFQINTKIVRPYVFSTKPKNINDISALTALLRPGAMDAPAPNSNFKGSAAEYYVAVAQGKEVPYYIHEDIRHIFEKTNSICVLQEQTLRVFRDIAEYTYETSEVVRRAIGKKDIALMELHIGMLKEKCIKRGWTIEQADRLADTLIKTAGYQFNASHSCSYAIVAYNGCWLKKHYPLHFWKGELTVNSDNHDKLRSYFSEFKEYLLPVSVLKSHPSEWMIEEGGLRPPLSLLKGCGEKSVEILKRFIDTPLELLISSDNEEDEEEFSPKIKVGSPDTNILIERGNQW